MFGVMSLHYLVKCKSSFVCSAVYNIYYTIKCLTSPVHNEISIHITSIYCVLCLQCSVNRSYKCWLWQEPVDVLCVVDYPASSVRWGVFTR